ncbi:MAG TPA: hypothetical protein DCQ31_01760 [Bacteroidales bacterium]|nr:hypothetical protein [Bacteroidales bacterium]
MLTTNFLTQILSKRTVQHMLFWSFFLFFEVLHAYDKSDDINFQLAVFSAIGRMLSAIIVVYINLLVFIPLLLEKNKPVLYFAAFAATIISVVFLVYSLSTSVFDSLGFQYDNLPGRPKLIVVLFAQTLVLSIITSLIHFTKRWVKLKDIEIHLKEEQRQRLEAELKALKAQINPHFLFNSLNNIYSLSLDKSDLAPVMILKLSDLMSYILYDAGHETVEFSKEIEFVQNHIELEYIRVKNRASLSFEFDESLNNKQIAPLLFTPFIENAFKYLANSKQSKAIIEIKFTEENGHLRFYIRNSAEAERATFDRHNHGIGIENVKKRLKIIYPRAHTLEIEHSTEFFTVNLLIEC